MLRPLAPARSRLHAGLVVVLVALAVIGGRLVQLQGLTPAYAEVAEQQRLRKTVLNAPRGEITDRSGQAIAMSVQARAVYGEPRTIAKAACPQGAAEPCDPQSIAARLSPVVGVPAPELAEKLANTKTAFVYLARDKSPEVGNAVRALRLPGVGVLSEERRTHPAKDLAASVVGYTDNEGRGLGGIESAWESTLAGKDGTTTATVDGKGRIIPTGRKSEVAPVPGRDVQLTLDRDLQWYAQDLLAKKVAEVQAENGSAIVLDVRTGEVLALATAPSFDPDDRAGTPAARLGNPAVSEVYEPGSVNKVITAAAALEQGVVTPQTVLTVPDSIRVANRRIGDAESHPVERLTFTGVLVKSSNVGTIMVAQKLGPQRIYDALRRFGFGDKSGLGLPGESRGIVPKPADWSGTSIGNIPIGQGVAVNVVQIASVYATLANGGVRVTPNIVKAVAGPDGRMVPAPKPTSRRVVSADVAGKIRLMLEGVVTSEGTAPLAAVPGYRTAGKTGTAQRVVPGKGYVPGNYTSSFIGMAPADDPRLVVAVVLQGTGKKDYFGGSTAGPVFKDVMSFALQSVKAPPTQTTPAPLCLLEGCPK